MTPRLPFWMREDFEGNVGRLFEAYGFVPIRRGWPDFAIFTKAGALTMMVEVKAPGDHVDPQQALIHDALRALGVDVRVVRHEDIPALIHELSSTGLIERTDLRVMSYSKEAADRVAEVLRFKEKRQRPSVSRDRGQDRASPYCIDESCPSVLRHARHRISPPPVDLTYEGMCRELDRLGL